MKIKFKYLVGFLLILLGTNLFTYATTRYQTTSYVLTRANERLNAALKTDGLYDQIYPFGGVIEPRYLDIPLAIKNAGGLYFWWNGATLYWFASVMLVLAGMGVAFHTPKRASAG